MKKLFCLLLALSMLLGIAACGDTTNSGAISEKDMQRPSKTNLDSLDHSMTTDGEILPAYDESKWYINELKDVPLPDPHVYEEDGVYYIYGTTDRTGAKSFDCYYTTDFVNYELERNIYTVPTNTEWEKQVLFAPEMYCFDGEYYLYYSNEHKAGRRYLTVVKGSTPLGPFEQINEKDANGKQVNGLKAPVFNDGKGMSVLDQTIFIDDDGEMYTYYAVSGSTQHIVGCKMLDPITIDYSTYKQIVIPGELNQNTTNTKFLSWECFNGYNIAEGPFMLKSPNGFYYMTYSVNSYENRYYSICYAVSDSPLGTFEKPYTPEDKQAGKLWTNLLVGFCNGKVGPSFEQWEGYMSGVGHHSFFKVGDQLMIAYHAHRNRKDHTQGRALAIDYLYFDEDGVPIVHGPSYSVQPLPEDVSGYTNIALNATVKVVNVENAAAINDNYIEQDYFSGEPSTEVTLKAGKSYIELVFDKEYEIGGIMVFNSAWYDKALFEIDFINFFNDNVLFNVGFPLCYINEEKEFIYPCSAFTAEFDDIKAKRVLLAFNTADDVRINEIKVLGK